MILREMYGKLRNIGTQTNYLFKLYYQNRSLRIIKEKLKVRLKFIKFFVVLLTFIIIYGFMMNVLSIREHGKVKLQQKYFDYDNIDDNIDKRMYEPTDQETVNIEYDDVAMDRKTEQSRQEFFDYLRTDNENYLQRLNNSKLFKLKYKFNRTKSLITNFMVNQNNVMAGFDDTHIDMLTLNILQLISYLDRDEQNSSQNTNTRAVTPQIKDTAEVVPKVPIHFRLTNIYRIDLNCFWTRSLNLYTDFVFEYRPLDKNIVSFCPKYERNLKLVNYQQNSTVDIIKYLIDLVKTNKLNPYDGLFLNDFLTRPLTNGGGWFPYFDQIKYTQLTSQMNRNIFRANVKDLTCVPKERIAIIVAIRDREENLNNFLIYMHFFLQKQLKSYKIFVVEQMNPVRSGILFNKGRLYNMGFKHVIRDHVWQYNCIILHDVDLLPLNADLDYSCDNYPKHMSINVRRLNDDSLSPHYRFLTGGVLAVRPWHYRKINGYSNEYFGWGGEDDDLSIRIVERELCALRSANNISNYVMQSHSPSKENAKRWEKIMTSTERIDVDGLTNIERKAKIVSVDEFPKFTRVLVDVAVDKTASDLESDMWLQAVSFFK